MGCCRRDKRTWNVERGGRIRRPVGGIGRKEGSHSDARAYTTTPREYFVHPACLVRGSTVYSQGRSLTRSTPILRLCIGDSIILWALHIRTPFQSSRTLFSGNSRPLPTSSASSVSHVAHVLPSWQFLLFYQERATRRLTRASRFFGSLSLQARDILSFPSSCYVASELRQLSRSAAHRALYICIRIGIDIGIVSA